MACHYSTVKFKIHCSDHSTQQGQSECLITVCKARQFLSSPEVHVIKNTVVQASEPCQCLIFMFVLFYSGKFEDFCDILLNVMLLGLHVAWRNS